MNTVYGRLADALGHSASAGRFAASPAHEYLHEQNPEIPIDRDHDHHPVGEIFFLARNGPNLWAVGEVREDVAEAVNVRVGSRTVAVPTPLYWSASRIGGPGDGLALDWVSLTASPASVDPRPVTFLEGRLDHRQAANRWRSRLDRVEFALLERAAIARADRRRGDPIVIAELDKPPRAAGLTKIRGRHGGHVWIDRDGEALGASSGHSAEPLDEAPPVAGPLRFRPCQILRVS